jgi:hypothetical protein
MLEKFESYQIDNATSIYGGAADTLIIVDLDVL